jgi:dTMP kinase
MFISLEGPDGSGKTTQMAALKARLASQGREVLVTREPGGTPIGDQIREVLLNRPENTQMVPEAEILLFCASRAQLVGEVIRPALASGMVVLCDRYRDSTMAYQGYGHGLPLATLDEVLDFATGGLLPDLTLFFDLPPLEGLRRRNAGRFTGEEWNRLDQMDLSFHQRVYQGYEQLMAGDDRGRWARIDATADAATVGDAAWAAVAARLAAAPVAASHP